MNGILHKSIRGLYSALRPATRNSLHLALLLTAHDRPPSCLDSFPERQVLVLAPHADDEIIGCGGILALHARSGANIAVAYMTDGRWGDARLFSGEISAQEARLHQTRLVETRKKEAADSTALLGIRHLYFLDAEDSKLQPDPTMTDRLYRLLMEFAPDCVYLPFLMDGHEDHWQTNRVFHAALRRLPDDSRDRITCRGYEVWNPLVANRVVDISDVMALKLQALDAYQSQLKDVDYSRCTKGINTYRAMHIGAKGYAEAFFECTTTEYNALFERIVA